MTEKEKMLAGELYDCYDPELIDRWHRAKELQKQYEQTSTRNSAALNAILDELIGSRGDCVSIAAPIYVDYGENIHLGNNIEINMNCTLLDCNRITIGDNSGIGPSVQIYTVGHPIKAADRLSKSSAVWISSSAPVTIGRNVWIGGGSIILPGVTIGDNTTIGAGSVVSKSIPANCLAIGNPCRIIREL